MRNRMCLSEALLVALWVWHFGINAAAATVAAIRRSDASMKAQSRFAEVVYKVREGIRHTNKHTGVMRASVHKRHPSQSIEIVYVNVCTRALT